MSGGAAVAGSDPGDLPTGTPALRLATGATTLALALALTLALTLALPLTLTLTFTLPLALPLAFTGGGGATEAGSGSLQGALGLGEGLLAPSLAQTLSGPGGGALQ